MHVITRVGNRGLMKLTPNRLLTQLLTEIGEEKTESVLIDGKPVKVTKAEAVARGLYEMAQGGLVDKINPKTQEITQVYVKPDAAAVRLIREYTEGKPSQDTVKEATDKKRAGEYGSGTRKRLAEVLNKPKKAKKSLQRPMTEGTP